MADARPNSFKSWLFEQSARQDAVGAFARSSATNATFPNEAVDVRQELRRFGASAQTMADCAEAIREYNTTA